MLISILAETD
jgi:hypothetical protein